MARKLVPLRIPSGWAVVFNIFVEFNEDEPMTPWDADAYLSQDILSIEPVVFSDHRWVNDPGGWLLDLGWNNPGETEGEYVLTALHGGWDDPTAVFHSRDWRAIQHAIDHALERISAGCSVDGLSDTFRQLPDRATPAERDR